MTIAIMIRRKSILLVSITVVLMSSLLYLSGPVEELSARPDILEWSTVTTPDSSDRVVLTPSEVNELVVGYDYETFYVIDIPTWHDDDEDTIIDPGERGYVYKTDDEGLSWTDELTETLQDDGATLPAWDIAVAPDDTDLLAVVTDDRQKVFISEYGGEYNGATEDIWVDLQVANSPGWDTDLLIADIAISPLYGSSQRDIAIGTRKPDGTTAGDVWIMTSNIFGGWKAQALNLDVSQVRFSPNYADDKALVTVASDTDNTYFCTGVRYLVENETDWEVTEPDRVEISTGADLSPGEGELVYADISLPSNYEYIEESPKKRTVFVSYRSGTDADDVYRIEDTDVYRLELNDAEEIAIASIDYRGSYSDGDLLVGEVVSDDDTADALIHFCDDPFESLPEWQQPEKAPTGGVGSGVANAVVVWGKTSQDAYCGTSTNFVETANDWADVSFGPWRGDEADESAFSVTGDGCDTWNQLSLIDTNVHNLRDYFIDYDEKTLYLATSGGGFDSLWRSDSTPLGEQWQRVLCFEAPGDDIILRAADREADNKDLIFIAVKGTDDARYSSDGWQTWKSIRSCPDITDMVVVDDERLYILDDNLVNKGVWNPKKYGGDWEWDRDIETELDHGYSISALGNVYVFVGEDGGEGQLAYSTDGASSFALTEGIPEPGKMVMVVDEDFKSNRFVYVATDDSSSSVYRWAVRAGTEWEDLSPPHYGFTGLVQRSSALYGAPAGAVDRILVPHQDTVREEDWDSLTEGLAPGVSFRSGTLQAIKGEELVDIWAIDERDYYNGTLDRNDPAYDSDIGRLWVYSDIFVLQSPWPTSPTIGEVIPCDICNCMAEGFCFTWRRLPMTKEYDIWVALDEEFNFRVIEAEYVLPDDSCDPAWCLPEEPFDLDCGDIYYWKVRGAATCGDDLVHSRWSPPVRFSIMAGTNWDGMQVAPILIAPVSGADGESKSPSFSWKGIPSTDLYRFTLASDAQLSQIVVQEEVQTTAYLYEGELELGATYYWQVQSVAPAPSRPSGVSVFTVGTPVEEQELPPYPPFPVREVKSSTPAWIWWIIAILTLLNVLAIVAIMRRRY